VVNLAAVEVVSLMVVAAVDQEAEEMEVADPTMIPDHMVQAKVPRVEDMGQVED
jgi:hypothetical protein